MVVMLSEAKHLLWSEQEKQILRLRLRMTKNDSQVSNDHFQRRHKGKKSVGCAVGTIGFRPFSAL